MTKDEALIKIATVNAMDYEYQAWARQALANDALEKMAENARELGLDYEPQRTLVGLTDDEIKIIWCDIDGSNRVLMRFARAIEAAVQEKQK